MFCRHKIKRYSEADDYLSIHITFMQCNNILLIEFYDVIDNLAYVSSIPCVTIATICKVKASLTS